MSNQFEIAISNVVCRDVLHSNGNREIAFCDVAIDGLIRIEGVLLLLYSNGSLTAFQPRTQDNRRAVSHTALFIDFGLRKAVAAAALRAFYDLGGRIADMETNPELVEILADQKVMPIVKLPDVPLPSGMTAWVAVPDREHGNG